MAITILGRAGIVCGGTPPLDMCRCPLALPAPPHSACPGCRKNLDGEHASEEETTDNDSAELGDSVQSCFGVDMNRNWQAGGSFIHRKDLDNSEDKCSSSYEGAAPFSEKETRAMKATDPP
jgi:hypothetical protein